MYQFKKQKNNESRSLIQASLKVGQPGDKYEQEADRVADRVMRMSGNEMMQRQPEEEEEPVQTKIRMQPMEEEEEELQPKLRLQKEEEILHPKLSLGLVENAEELLQPNLRMQPMEEPVQTKIQMQPMEEEEEMMQPKANKGVSMAPQGIVQHINSSKGNGTSLPIKTNNFMSNAFGTDFSGVQIHTGSKAVQMNKQLGARALTYGNNIYFNSGEYNPHSSSGKSLLAHELTHVVQQNAAKSIAKTPKGIIQRLSIGPGPTTDRDWRAVPANHVKRVNSALAIIRRVSGNRRLINYFRDHAPGGTLTTLQNVVNRAIVWELRNEGNLGLSVEGGNDMAYDMLIYRIGRYQIAATLLHEMGHLASFTTEAECEGTPEAARNYAPFITSVSRRSGRVGDIITITGISFGPSQSSVDKVKFNGVNAGNAIFWRWRHNTQGQIQIRVPAGATTGSLVVENNTIPSNAIRFTVVP